MRVDAEPLGPCAEVRFVRGQPTKIDPITRPRGQPCAAAGTAISMGRGDSHATPYCDDRKAAPVGPASGRGGARQAAMDCGVRRRRAPSRYGVAVCGGGVRQVVMDRGAVARRSPRCCWSWCCSMPNPRFATGLAGLRVRRATRAARPRIRPNRPLLHCRPKRRGDGESGTNRREDYRANGDGCDLGSEKVRDVHSVPPIRRPAGRHPMRRPYGVTTPRCRRLGRSARRRWRTR